MSYYNSTSNFAKNGYQQALHETPRDSFAGMECQPDDRTSWTGVGFKVLAERIILEVNIMPTVFLHDEKWEDVGIRESFPGHRALVNVLIANHLIWERTASPTSLLDLAGSILEDRRV